MKFMNDLKYKHENKFMRGDHYKETTIKRFELHFEICEFQVKCKMFKKKKENNKLSSYKNNKSSLMIL